jgi:hypothetical protein
MVLEIQEDQELVLTEEWEAEVVVQEVQEHQRLQEMPMVLVQEDQADQVIYQVVL